MVSVTVVKAGGEATRLYKRKQKKNKTSKPLRPLEKLTRRLVSASSDAGQLFERRYRRSRGKRNGFIRDMPFNVLKAQRRFGKRLKLQTLCWR